MTPSDYRTVLPLRSTLRVSDVADVKREFDALLTADSAHSITCDASAVEFIDAAGLQLLVALRSTLSLAGGHFTVQSPSAAFCSAATTSGYAPHIGME